MTLSDTVRAERVAGFDRWLHTVANSLHQGSEADHQDLVQEGRIAIWKALGKEDLDSERWAGYVTMKAKGRMIDILSGKIRQTGHAAPEGKVVTNERGREARAKIAAYLGDHPGATGREIAAGTGLSASTVSVQRKQLDIDTPIAEPGSLDALKEAGYDAAGIDDGLLDLIVHAYMYGQIRQALEALTPNERRYVDLRFWEGYTPPELKAAFGYDPVAIWRTAKERLRPVLEQAMAA